MIETHTLFGIRNLVDLAVDRIRKHEPNDGYYLAFSGGKDSIVIKQLAIEAGVKFDAHYNVTTIDPPDLVYYIRQHHPDVKWEHPKEPFLRLLVKKGFPLRQRRWCCEVYKERGGQGRTLLTGLRSEESPKRARLWGIVTVRADKRFVNPIIDWASDEVWEYIRLRSLSYCKLYDEGWHRLGCLFCPFADPLTRQRERKRYPGMERAFRRAFNQLYEDRKINKPIAVAPWKSGDELFEWWITGGRSPKRTENQIELWRQARLKE